MRMLVPILACLMLVITIWGSMVHAAETVGVQIAETEMVVHGPHDGDEVRADADTGYPHHHVTCHEHHMNTPVVRTTATPVVMASARPTAMPPVVSNGHDGEADLRPPRA